MPLFTRPLLIFQAGKDLFGGQLELHKFDSTPPEWIAAHANSVLAYCANALWTFTGTQEHKTEAIKYSTSCMTGLRKCLDLAKEHPEFKVEELVYRLLRAEMVGKNFSSASIHAKYLQQLLKSKAEAGALDPESLTMVIHSDNNLALGRMSRPIFESSWLHGAFAQSWDQADMLFPNYASYDIDYRAPSIELQELLVAENKLFWQSSILRVSGNLANQTNWHWFISQREWIQNRMLHHYADMVEEDRCVPKTGAMASSVDALFERCLLLAAFIALRYQKKIAAIRGIPLHNSSIALERLVDSAFAALEQAADEDWLQAHAQPVIWIIFAVALTEHKLNRCWPALRNKRPWLMRLRHYIKKARLRSWPQLLAVLGKFPFTEQELPLPHEDWLDEAFAGA